MDNTAKPRRTRHFRWRDFRKPWPDAAPLGDLLPLALEQLGLDADRIRLGHLWEHWPYVMGPELAGMACPLGTHKDVLLLGCEDNMLMQEITLCRDEILERVNAFMEKPYFHNIKASLLMGRCNLARPRPKPQVKQQVFESNVRGTYLDRISPDTPWGRCYATYAGVYDKDNNLN